MSKIPKVLIGLPTMGSVHTLLLVAIMYWVSEAVKNKDMDILLYPSLNVRPHDRARNHIVEEFMKTEATHLFFIDSDTVPPPDALKKLLQADRDIISGITPIIEHDPKRQNDSSGYYKKYNCVGMDEKHVEPNTGIVPIKGAGGSCILIKKEVFEKLEKPYYKFLDKDDNGKDCLVSEDIYFIIMAISKGITPYCDTSVIAQHDKNVLW